MTMAEMIVEGATATVIGMGIVMGVLALLAIILVFFKHLNPEPKPVSPQVKPEAKEAAPAAKEDTTPQPQQESFTDGGELIAVISAAIAACVGEDAQYAIRSVKQVQTAKPAGNYRAWNSAAIRENHRGLY